MIDDDPDVRDVLSEFLRLKLINVLATGQNGKEAVELYEKHTPDIVLMDFMMPSFDGVYGVKNIRKINPNAIIVILTGGVEYDVSKELTESGVSTILLKPYDMDYLIEIIDKLSLGDSIQEPLREVTWK